MASVRQTLCTSGPPPITSFDWNNLYHRTSLMSCLVKGVYTMERNRQGSRSPANIWWECYNFTLCKRLIDTKDGSIYGAVFQNVCDHENTPNSEVSPPRYVIAFRGTIIKPKTMVRDLKLDIRCVFQNLHHGTRCVQAIQEVQNFVTRYGNAAVWIAGHSLGASLALLAGKTMAISGFPVESYIFNPPVSLIPIEQTIRSEDVKCVIRLTMDIIKAGIAKVLDLNEGQEDNQYKNLASWKPYLFVNKSDLICSEYIGYFKHKVCKGVRGLSKIQGLASYSIRRLLFGRGESLLPDSSREHLHCLVSAFLMVNTEKSKFHGIHQWWNPMLESVSYQIKA